jgi:alkanesulfonate monooxygenase SsuD/methylene tetrahydromethanopterin reductase-like flavin-dependent oxidoreductase (luciferase family)
LGFYMGVNEERAQAARERYETYFGEQADRFVEGSLFGTPAAIVDSIGEYARAGVTDLNITMRAPYEFDAMQCFIEEVMPKI